MSTTRQHTNIPSTAVKMAPGLWRTNLQRQDLSVPGSEDLGDQIAGRLRHPEEGRTARVPVPTGGTVGA